MAKKWQKNGKKMAKKWQKMVKNGNKKQKIQKKWQKIQKNTKKWQKWQKIIGKMGILWVFYPWRLNRVCRRGVVFGFSHEISYFLN